MQRVMGGADRNRPPPSPRRRRLNRIRPAGGGGLTWPPGAPITLCVTLTGARARFIESGELWGIFHQGDCAKTPPTAPITLCVTLTGARARFIESGELWGIFHQGD